MLNEATNAPTGVVKIEKSSGPNTEPCGTPISQTTVGEWQLPMENTARATRQVRFQPVGDLTGESKQISCTLQETSMVKHVERCTDVE
jgi:hypothetical protein